MYSRDISETRESRTSYLIGCGGERCKGKEVKMMQNWGLGLTKEWGLSPSEPVSQHCPWDWSLPLAPRPWGGARQL